MINKLLGPDTNKSRPLYSTADEAFSPHGLIDTLTPQFIKIGHNCRLGTQSIIVSHDASYFFFTGKYRIEPVELGDNVIIGVGVIILPGVKIGNRVVIGAGSVVTHDIPDNSVVAGNPARVISSIEEYIKKARGRGVLYAPPYSWDDIHQRNGKVNDQQKAEFQKSVIAKYRSRNPQKNSWIKYTEQPTVQNGK